MQFLLLSALIALLAYLGWRVTRASATRTSSTRVIGPDDDPEFLRRLGG